MVALFHTAARMTTRRVGPRRRAAPSGARFRHLADSEIYVEDAKVHKAPCLLRSLG